MSQKKLSAKAVQALAAPGRHHVGDGLYLQIKASGSRSWVFRYMRSGRAREMGLGSYPAVTLATAREKAVAMRKGLAHGVDPFDARIERGIAVRKGPSFDEAAARYIDAHKAGWSNAKHARQWVSSLRDYASPAFGDKPVGEISAADILAAIEPIWTAKTETASRVRMRIEAVLDWACVHGMRDSEKPNPARWKGYLEFALPKRAKIAPVKHFPALDWRLMPEFWTSLAAQPGVAAFALRFTILTAARAGEALGALWQEIDRDSASWSIPAQRMKGRRDHRTPLSRQSLEILARVGGDWGTKGFVFPGQGWNRPLSSTTMLRALPKRDGVTVHGFRSTFRDWVAEATEFSGETAEAALAHSVGDKVEAAYRRGNLFDKRRELMQAWADYCCGARETI